MLATIQLNKKQISHCFKYICVYCNAKIAAKTKLLESLDDTDPENVDQIKSYLMARNNIEKSLRADSWGTAVQQDVITEEEQADFAEFDVTALLTQDLTALGEKLNIKKLTKETKKLLLG